MTRDVFSSGLADPNLWTSNLDTLDGGFNWFQTRYTKFTFRWNHAVFGDPVLDNATSRQPTSDLFLVRFQLDF